MTLAILLFGLGLILAVAEIFIPSMGILSVLAAAAVIGSLVSAFGVSTSTGLTFLTAVAVVFPVALILGFRLFPRTPLGRRMVVGGLSFESSAATDERDLDLVGRDGVTLSDLRPAGFARIEGPPGLAFLDDSRGEGIENGTPVRVLEVSGNRVVVTRADAGAPSDEADDEPSTADT